VRAARYGCGESQAKIAFGEVRSLKQLSEMEWAEYWGAVQEVSDRNGGRYRLPGRPWRFSGEKLDPLGEPAFQREHNRGVFAELGFSDEQIDGYVALGALVGASIRTAVVDFHAIGTPAEKFTDIARDANS
jgi:hypothetical protein